VSIVLYVVGVALLAAGVAGLLLPVLPGAVLLVAGVVALAWAGDFAILGWGTVAFAGAMGLAITAVDWAASLLGAKAFGASRWAVVGSAVGLVVGLFLGLPGIILGPAVGALAFEYARNPDFQRALQAGLGAFVGFVVGSVLKVTMAFALIGVVALRYLFR
jgi:uncharacterized protein YqgC (DUF456 family)